MDPLSVRHHVHLEQTRTYFMFLYSGDKRGEGEREGEGRKARAKEKERRGRGVRFNFERYSSITVHLLIPFLVLFFFSFFLFFCYLFLQVVINFHGYPSALKQLLFARHGCIKTPTGQRGDAKDTPRFYIHGYPLSPLSLLFHSSFSLFLSLSHPLLLPLFIFVFLYISLNVNRYIEEGTTTTPLDMAVSNQSSRFHIAIEVCSRTREKRRREGEEERWRGRRRERRENRKESNKCIQAIKVAGAMNPAVAVRAVDVVTGYKATLRDFAKYVSSLFFSSLLLFSFSFYFLFCSILLLFSSCLCSFLVLTSYLQTDRGEWM